MRTATPVRASALKAPAQSLWRVMTTSTPTPRRAAAWRACTTTESFISSFSTSSVWRAEVTRATSASWAPGLQTRSAGEAGGSPPFVQSLSKVASMAATSAGSRSKTRKSREDV